MCRRPGTQDRRPKRYGVARLWAGYWAVLLALLVSGMANVAGPWCPCAHAQQATDPANKSWTDSITAPFKKLGQAFSPKPSASAHVPEDEAVSLKSRGKAGPELYLAVARVYEQSGKPAEAEQQYRAALIEYPDNLPVLLTYAQLKDNLGQLDEAIQLYQARSQGTSAAGVDLQQPGTVLCAAEPP